jgi:hypothetical protein
MENHLWKYDDKICTESSTENTPTILHNLFGPSAQIGQLFGIFLRKVPITIPLSWATIR